MTNIFFRNHNVGRLYLSILVGSASLVACAATLMLPQEAQRGMTIILIILSVLFSFLWCWPITSTYCPVKTDYLHPSFLFVGFYIVYFVFSGFIIYFYYDYRSNWVDLGVNPELTVNTVFILGLLSVAAFGLGLRAKVKFPGKKLKTLLYRQNLMRRTEGKFVIVLYLLVGGALTLYHLSLLGPLSFDLFRYLSPSAQSELEIGWNNVFLMLESMLEWGALIALFFLFQNSRVTNLKRQRGIWLISIILCFVIGVLVYTLTGKRSSVIPLLLLPLIWRHYFITRLKMYYIINYIGLFCLVVTLLLMARIIVPIATQNIDIGNTIGESVGEIAEFYLNTPELATFDMVIVSLLQRELLLSEMGGAMWAFLKYNIGTILLVFVPPGTWVNKPLYEDPGHKYFQVIMGSTDYVGFSVTAWGTSFLFLHVLGVLLGMFVLGWFFNGIYKLLRPWEGKPFDVFFYAIFYWIAFQFLRFGTLGFTFLIFVTSMLMGVLAALFLARNKYILNMK